MRFPIQNNKISIQNSDALLGAALFLLLIYEAGVGGNGMQVVLCSFVAPMLYILMGYRDEMQGAHTRISKIDQDAADTTQVPASRRRYLQEQGYILLGCLGIAILVTFVDLCRLQGFRLASLSRIILDNALRFWNLSKLSNVSHPSAGVLWIMISIVLIRIVYHYVLRHFPAVIALGISLITSVGAVVLARQEQILPLSLDISCVGLLFYVLGITYARYAHRLKSIVIYSIAVLFTAYWLLRLYKGFYIDLATREYKSGSTILEAICGAFVVIVLLSLLVTQNIRVQQVLSVAGRHVFLFLGLYEMSGYFAILWDGADLMPTAVLQFGYLVLGICAIQQFRMIMHQPVDEADRNLSAGIAISYADASCWIEWAFDLTFAGLFITTYIKSTMLTQIVDGTVLDTIYVVCTDVLFVIVLLRIWSRQEQRALVLRCLILFTGIMVWNVSSREEILAMCLLIIAGEGMHARRVLWISLVSAFAVIMIAYLASLHGYIAWLDYGIHGHAMGSIYRTDHAAMWLYLLILYRLLRGRRMSVIEYALQTLLVCYIQHVTQGKTFAVVAPLFLTLCYVFDYLPSLWKSERVWTWMQRIGTVWFVLVTVFSYVAAFVGGPIIGDEVPVETQVFYTVRARIYYSYYSFLHYPIKLFAKGIRIQGAGGVQDWTNTTPYFFLDNVYVNMLFMNGVLFLLIMLGVHTYAMRRSVRERNYVMWLSLFVVAIDSVMEHHLSDFAYNVVPVIVWARWDMQSCLAPAAEENSTEEQHAQGYVSAVVSQLIGRKERIRSIILAAIVALLFMTESNRHPLIHSLSMTDSNVFQTIAMMMQNGFMPYKDSFDHKGPLTYILNYIGRVISPTWGIWLVELVLLTVTFYWLYRIARMHCGVFLSWFAVLLSMVLLFTYFQEGNYTEEYAMPFIAVSLWIFLDYYRQQETTNARLFICGACLGVVLMLRPNMISVWMVFALAIVVDCARKAQWEMLRRYVIFVAAGMLVVILPMLVWLVWGGALQAFWECYIIFNMQYSSSTWLARGQSLLHFGVTIPCLVSIAAIVAAIRMDRTHRIQNTTYLIYMIVTLLLITMSGDDYDHYGMILVPMFVYPMALVLAWLSQERLSGIVRVGGLVAGLCAAYYMIWPSWSNVCTRLQAIYETRVAAVIERMSGDENITENAESVSDTAENAEEERPVAPDGTDLSEDTSGLYNVLRCIDQYTDENDTISVYGNWDVVYLLSGRRHATRYSYQNPIGMVDSTIMEAYYTQLAEELPQVIVIEPVRNSEDRLAFQTTYDITSFLEEHQYTAVTQDVNKGMVYVRMMDGEEN